MNLFVRLIVTGRSQPNTRICLRLRQKKKRARLRTSRALLLSQPQPFRVERRARVAQQVPLKDEYCASP